MKLMDIYCQNPALLGSHRMIAFFEELAGIPNDKRVATLKRGNTKGNFEFGPISITSDGFIISNGEFFGGVDELENNLYLMCDHFSVDRNEAKELMKNTTDWRPGGNAYI